MIQYSDVQVGDYLLVDNEGTVKRGEVTRLNGNEKQVCVNNGVQEFWYETNQLLPLPVNEEELKNLKFTGELNEEGQVKYSKGAFRLAIPAPGDFTKFELWYRDERRIIPHPISVNVLQNHFLDMTKVHLDDNSF